MSTNQYYGKVVSVKERWNDLHYVLGKTYAGKNLAKRIDREGHITTGSAILDIGCAEGDVTHQIANYFLLAESTAVFNRHPQIDAIELENTKFKVAHRKFRNISNINVFNDNITDIGSNHLDKYDYIFALGVLHKLTANELDVVIQRFKIINSTIYLRLPYSFNTGYIYSKFDNHHIQIFPGIKHSVLYCINKVSSQYASILDYSPKESVE